jgi:hypothetical protein
MDYRAVEAIDGPIIPRKQAAKRHYGVHPYFTKRAWNVVQEYIKRYTKEGDTVLDPYGGSGVTAVESLVLGRKAIHIDISPLGNFITQQVAISPINLHKLKKTFDDVTTACKGKINALYDLSDEEIEKTDIPYWYPKNVKLSSTSDAVFVDELFTRRSLIAFSILHKTIRDIMLFTFSGTLVKVNRTFVSTTGNHVQGSAFVGLLQTS